MTPDEKLILFYLLMSTGMLPSGFSDLLSEKIRKEIKDYQTAIEQVINNK